MLELHILPKMVPIHLSLRYDCFPNSFPLSLWKVWYLLTKVRLIHPNNNLLSFIFKAPDTYRPKWSWYISHMKTFIYCVRLGTNSCYTLIVVSLGANVLCKAPDASIPRWSWYIYSKMVLVYLVLDGPNTSRQK